MRAEEVEMALGADSSGLARPGEHALRELFRSEVPGVSTVGSPEDKIFTTMEISEYLETGQWAFRRIRLAMLAAERDTFTSILDLGSGYGRVLRVLKAAFPDAQLTACDIHKPAVDFCAELFDATPVYGDTDPELLTFDQPFDLIWAGSLFTHLGRRYWTRFLKACESWLEPGGLLVFTSQGKFSADELLRKGAHNLGLVDEQIHAVLDDYDSEGFGYCNYEVRVREFMRERGLPVSYGISLAKPWWVLRRIERDAPKLDPLTYTAGGWGDRWGEPRRPPLPTTAQDVVSCIRRAG